MMNQKSFGGSTKTTLKARSSTPVSDLLQNN